LYFFEVGFVVVYRGFLRKMVYLMMVFCWCERGGSVVQRGVLAVTFLGLKNTPRILGLFFALPFWSCEGVLLRVMSKVSVSLVS
jgi:hypothetical protein